MRRLVRRAAVYFFFALSLVPVVLFGVTGPWPGGTMPEFRPLKPFPEVLAASTFRRVAAWFNDREGMRYPLLKLGIEWSFNLWQPRIRGDVILGTDPWLFWSDDESRSAAAMNDVRGRLRPSDDEAAKAGASMEAIRQSVAACGRRAFVVVAPNKQSIYPEQTGLRTESGAIGYLPSRLDGLLEKLNPAARAMVIDLRPALREAKAAHPAPVYYQTDTHWNALGAFYAYRSVVETLARAQAIDRPELAALANYDLTIAPYAGGDMASRVLSLPWRFADLKPTLKPKAGLAPVMRRQEGVEIRYVNPEGNGRLLINGDSFAESLGGLLARHFAEVIVLPRPPQSGGFDGAVTVRLRADVTLIEVVERSLPDLVAPPRNTDRACASD